ncbi:hypothetical protein GCM10020367_09970 [Streptomyces sannanensis]|uniref:SGNH hydrolase-type esterase domain-containing protein n=1 Tax=Streptomyces sannanensis TaxID=285536 RepID=A0ABP6S649_9ACTN
MTRIRGQAPSSLEEAAGSASEDGRRGLPGGERHLAACPVLEDGHSGRPGGERRPAARPAFEDGHSGPPDGGRHPVEARPVRFAALGDSLSEGVGDPVHGTWRGWAELLAGGLAVDVEFRKLAVSGALTRDVAERQTPEALEFGPDIASVVVGVNDTLRHSFDIHALALRFDEVCAALAGRGAVLLTACLPDPGAMLGLPAPLARPLARRQRAVNAVVHAVSARHDAVHLHAADAAWVADRSIWSADRLHPGERGHRMMAARFHELLTARGLALGTAPGTDPEQPPPSRAASLLWLATAGTGWVARRSTDLLPQLLALAASEVRHWARGTSVRLDQQAARRLSAALAAVSASPWDFARGTPVGIPAPTSAPLREWEDERALGVLDRPRRHLHGRGGQAARRPARDP